jgi:hypothetical protein
LTNRFLVKLSHHLWLFNVNLTCAPDWMAVRGIAVDFVQVPTY